MSRNLYKSNWVVVTDEDKCVIDSNARLEQRIEELETIRRHRMSIGSGSGGAQEDEDGEPEFVGGLAGEQIDALLADGDSADGIIKGAAQPGADEEEAKTQIQAMMDDAHAEIEEMKETARREIEQERQHTLRDANKLGYDEGYKDGLAQADEMKRELDAEKQRLYDEYDRMVEELEPRFIDTITEVYSHVFGIEFADNRDILVHLIDSTLRQVESSRTFLVHVSKEDYPFVNMKKQELTEGAAAGRGLVEIIEDIALSQGDCLIETDGGIFDCGVDTQLRELTNRLRVLSFEKSND